MNVVELNHVSKAFGAVKAVDDVSFSVAKGEFFGLLGPNGAGKTTSIRILLDLFKPDQGSTSILGGAMTEAKKERIGYMPEERGMYQDIALEQVLVFLASLKGMSSVEVKDRLPRYLKQFDLYDHRRKKVKELSKGMQQKAQIISTLLHNPELLIIDEPFSGLDPVNTQMVKDVLRDLHAAGTTIIMSTHQMSLIEELCERILMIDHGKTVLYGPLAEIRRRFAGNDLLLRTSGTIPRLPGILSVVSDRELHRLKLSDDTNPQSILRGLLEHDIVIEHFEVALPSLDQIFVRVVNGEEPLIS